MAQRCSADLKVSATFSRPQSAHASGLGKRVEAKDRQENRESPKHLEVDQPLLRKFTVTFPLGIGERCAGQRQYHKGQRDEQVKQPLGIDKPKMEQIPELTQSRPFPPRARLPIPISYRKDKPPCSQIPASPPVPAGARNYPCGDAASRRIRFVFMLLNRGSGFRLDVTERQS